MAHAVVSLLDHSSGELVENLWAELEREFGVKGIYGTPYGHFSYQVAEDYDVQRLADALAPVAASAAPFRVSTAGLGIFPGPRPVLYVPVVRTVRLSRFQHALWSKITPAATGVQPHYHPDHWMPHITIGYGDLNPDNLAQIVRHLSERSFSWEIPIDNLALIYERDGTQGLEFRLSFRGRKRKR